MTTACRKSVLQRYAIIDKVLMMQNKRISLFSREYARVLGTLYRRKEISGRVSYVTRGARYVSIGVRIGDPKRLKDAIGLSEQFALMVHADAIIARRDGGYVNYQIELPPTLWESYNRSMLPDVHAIGLAEKRAMVKFSFDDAPHALFAGASNSGKSVAMNSALVSLSSTFSPPEMGLVIIDTNSELEGFNRLSHLMLPIAETPFELVNAVKFVYALLLHRRERKIKRGRRLLLAIDEVGDVLKYPETIEWLQLIAEQGRKYRVNLMVGNQKPSHKKLPGILDNILNRFVGQVSDANVSQYLTGQSGLAAHRLTGRGDFIHVVNGAATRFQVAMATAGDYQSLPRRSDIKMVVVPDITGDNPSRRRLSPVPGRKMPSTPGRPKNQLDPMILAQYLLSPDLSVRKSFALGISRPNHYLHKKFAKQVLASVKEIRGEK